MQELTQEGHRALFDIARRHGVSTDAALTLLRAVAAGGGTMAQFSHPELGGMGQWTAGGMVMVGDMFNYGLKQRVDTLCSELAALLRGPRVFTVPPHAAGIGAGGQWWPAELGAPAASGSQNDMRYAYFPASRRLAIQEGGEVRVYDTGDHLISGVSQQQSGMQPLVFSSQLGPVRCADLPHVAATEPTFPVAAAGAPASQSATDSPRAGVEPIGKLLRAAAAEPPPSIAPVAAPLPQPAIDTPLPRIERPAGFPPPAATETSPPVAQIHARAPQPAADDPLAFIERLAELHQRGILSDEEFTTKKTELLRRL
jgi:hypothetical protein